MLLKHIKANASFIAVSLVCTSALWSAPAAAIDEPLVISDPLVTSELILGEYIYRDLDAAQPPPETIWDAWARFFWLLARIAMAESDRREFTGLNGVYDGRVCSNGCADAVLKIEQANGRVQGYLFITQRGLRISTGVCGTHDLPVATLPFQGTSTDSRHATGSFQRNVSVSIGPFSASPSVSGNFSFNLPTADYQTLSIPNVHLTISGVCSDTDLTFTNFQRRPETLAPTGLAASSPGPSASVILSWSEVPGATYQVFRSQMSHGPYTSVGSATSPSFTDTGVVPRTQYFYVVTAITASMGSSEYSGETSVTTWGGCVPSCRSQGCGDESDGCGGICPRTCAGTCCGSYCVSECRYCCDPDHGRCTASSAACTLD